mgnify:CR=1 FL=1
MKNTLKGALVAITLAAVPVAMPAVATAQTNGIATSNPTLAILRSQARINAYNQITQTYQAQIAQVRQIDSEVTQLRQSLDTNSDGQVSQAEAQANPNVVQQIQQKEQQIQQASQPLIVAQYYVLDQILNDYENAQNQVIQNKGIQIMLSPDAIQYAPAGTDVTADITAVMDQRLPQVSFQAPQNWRPSNANVSQLHEAIGQLTALAIRQQAAQQGGQAQPVTPQPQGR